MTIYTGVADENGDFTFPFSTEYTSGEKINVKSSKDGAEKTIELFAPSVPSGELLQIGGSIIDFPQNIDFLKINILGSIGDSAFSSNISAPANIFNVAKSLIINEGAIHLGAYSFENWAIASVISLPSTLLSIGEGAFYNWTGLIDVFIPDSVKTIGDYSFNGCSNIKNIRIGSDCNSIGDYAFPYLTNAISVTLTAVVPPEIQSTTFVSIKSTVKYYVPAASLAAYKAAPVWKTFASKIYAIP